MAVGGTVGGQAVAGLAGDHAQGLYRHRPEADAQVAGLRRRWVAAQDHLAVPAEALRQSPVAGRDERFKASTCCSCEAFSAKAPSLTGRASSTWLRYGMAG